MNQEFYSIKVPDGPLTSRLQNIAIGDEIENPFERDQNDLPLGAISHMIESNIRQRMGLEALELKQPDPKTRLLL